MKFETLKTGKFATKKQIIIGSIAVVVVLVASLTFFHSFAKYRYTKSMKLAQGTVNFKAADLNMVAVYQGEGASDTDYLPVDVVPASGYNLNTSRSYCSVEGEKDTTVSIAYAGGKVTISNLVRKGTKCYLYFDLIQDTEKPVITNVTTSVTETTITVNVSATDNIGVDKYYYQIDSEEVIEKSESNHTFTGLVLGSSHTIKVYVKDGRGNTSEEITKTVSTVGTSETTLAKLNINSSYIKSGNPDFTKTATGAETVADNGIYKTLDPMYGENAETYYWRGAATTNHVIFANKCWRIIRINGDGTIRLIYNGTPSGTAPNQTCPGNGSNSGSIAVTSQTYNASRNNASYVGYTYTVSEPRPTPSTGGTASNLKTQTETWFDSNITGDNLNKVDMQGKYCNDRRPQTGQSYGTSSFNYAAYERLYTNKKPTLECDAQDVYTLKAGAITADEVSMAGGVYGTSNSSYYLYNNAYYWTLSPFYWYSSGGAYVFYVQNNGDLNWYLVNSAYGVRPVINLKSNTEFATGGDGTTSKPYIVS